MNIPIIARLTVDALSALFALGGLVSLGGITHLRAVYRLWHYPNNFYQLAGLAQLTAALFLIVPQTRIWGIAGSGMIIFVTTVTLLHHRRYFWSVPAIMLLMALIPASMAHP